MKRKIKLPSAKAAAEDLSRSINCSTSGNYIKPIGRALRYYAADVLQAVALALVMSTKSKHKRKYKRPKRRPNPTWNSNSLPRGNARR